MKKLFAISLALALLLTLAACGSGAKAAAAENVETPSKEIPAEVGSSDSEEALPGAAGDTGTAEDFCVELTESREEFLGYRGLSVEDSGSTLPEPPMLTVSDDGECFYYVTPTAYEWYFFNGAGEKMSAITECADPAGFVRDCLVIDGSYITTSAENNLTVELSEMPNGMEVYVCPLSCCDSPENFEANLRAVSCYPGSISLPEAGDWVMLVRAEWDSYQCFGGTAEYLFLLCTES